MNSLANWENHSYCPVVMSRHPQHGKGCHCTVQRVQSVRPPCHPGAKFQLIHRPGWDDSSQHRTSSLHLAHRLHDGWTTSWSSISFTYFFTPTSPHRANNILLTGWRMGMCSPVWNTCCTSVVVPNSLAFRAKTSENKLMRPVSSSFCIGLKWSRLLQQSSSPLTSLGRYKLAQSGDIILRYLWMGYPLKLQCHYISYSIFSLRRKRNARPQPSGGRRPLRGSAHPRSKHKLNILSQVSLQLTHTGAGQQKL